ncbi:MAG: phospholipase D family protein [Sphingobacteriales bacterium JAD_PAG50586_3]|nr:MAG: phospholipase D family protein [Sphingobacteriales bacterium JAD_PAG50586_3]
MGKGANELLPLSKGDVLVVNMCFQSIESGIVNPFEIEKYSIKGVNIYNCENLHAKIYLFHDKAIICSANISENSQSNLIEAGVFVDEKSTINDISKYIDSICIEEITQGYIDLCKEKYNEPKNKGKIRGKQLIEKPAIILSRLWLINVRPALFKEEEDIILSRNKTLYKRKLQSPQNSIADIRFGASSSFIKNVREGDLVIRIFNQNKKTTVSEPMRVLGIDNGRKVNLKGHRNMFLRLEELRNIKGKKLDKF